ncbi:DnaD family protein [Spiroplasma endosymbiont of Anurida maritima]|uniref:DnaD family protein n=1 Tax=Spiroplasma endosymbiont of Anurida maritima TaxID=2967972 RepID=UPI0036D4403D
MLKNLFDKNYINKWRLLISNYMLIGLSEEQLVLILLIMNSSYSYKRFISSTEIARISNFDADKVDKMIEDLTDLNIINIKMNNDKLEMDLSPLFSLILQKIEETPVKKNSNKKSGKNNSYILEVEKTFNITLNSVEKDWVFSNIETEEDILELISFVNSLSTVDKNFLNVLKSFEQELEQKPSSLTKFNWIADEE